MSSMPKLSSVPKLSSLPKLSLKTDAPVASTAWKPKAAAAAAAAAPAPLTAASFPALPTRAATVAAAAVTFPVPTRAAAAAAAPVPLQSFADIARRGHAITESAKAEAERKALMDREREAREAREAALYHQLHPSFGGGGGSRNALPRRNVVETPFVPDEDAEPAGGGYDSNRYEDEDNAAVEDVEEENEDYE